MRKTAFSTALVLLLMWTGLVYAATVRQGQTAKVTEETESDTILMSDLGLSPGTQVDTVSGENCTIVFAQNGGNMYSMYNGGTVRMYGSNTMTVSSTRTISSIQIVFSATRYSFTESNSSVNTGVITYNDTVSTWTGTANEVIFTFTATQGSARIKSVIVTYTNEAVKTPTTTTFGDDYDGQTLKVNLKDSSSFVAPTATLTPAEAGELVYSSSDENVAIVDSATGAVRLINSGDVIITALFEGNDTYSASTASYTLRVMATPYASVKEMLEDLPDNFDNVLIKTNAGVTLTNAEVIYMDGDNAFVRENGYCFEIYGAKTLSATQKLNGILWGNYQSYYGIPEITNGNNSELEIGLPDDTEVIEPTSTTLSEILEFQHRCDLVKIDNVSIVSTDDKYYAKYEGDSVQLYRGLDMEQYVGKNVALTALFNNIYYGKPELMPLSVEVDTVDRTLVFVDAEGNTINDGDTIVASEMSELGWMEMPVMLKNNSSETEAAQLVIDLQEMPADGSSFQCCAFGSCVNMEAGTIGRSVKSTTGIEAGATENNDTEWIPVEGSYATWTASLSVEHFAYDGSSIGDRLGYGPKVYVKFVYDESTGIKINSKTNNIEIDKVYNVAGQEVPANSKGLLLYKMSDGRVIKVLK